MKRKRREQRLTSWAVLAVTCAALGLASGCDTDNPWQTFFDKAGSSLASGIKTIFDGAVDGAVAVIQAPSSSSQSTPSTTGT